MFNLKVRELTKDNETIYLDQVAELEKIVLENMNKEGKIRSTIYYRKRRYITICSFGK